MAMTLEELKKGMSDKVFSQIVDIFLRQSTVLQMLTFDDCVSASGGGSTMKYKVYVNETSLKKLLKSDNEDVRDSLVSAFLSANSTLEMESIESYASKLDITYKDENTKKKIENYISSQLKTEGDGEDE